MQIATITGPTFEIAKSRITLANRLRDGVELRLDLFKEELDLGALKALRDSCLGKFIFTLRSRKEGGAFIGSDDKRQKILLNLLSIEPDYLELDYTTSPDFIAYIAENHPHTKIIFSYYDLARTPKNLEFILQKMRSEFAYVYKIAVTGTTTSDAYRLLRFVQKKHQEAFRIIGLCMGEYKRIWSKGGAESGNYFDYTVLHGYNSGKHFA